MVDGLGNPVRFILSGGQVNDCKVAVPLLSDIDITGSNILADRAYGTNEILDYISENNAKSVIPSKSNAINQREIDWFTYKERHLIECFFNKMKQFRHIATRYDKLASSFLAFIYVASIFILSK